MVTTFHLFSQLRFTIIARVRKSATKIHKINIKAFCILHVNTEVAIFTIEEN